MIGRRLSIVVETRGCLARRSQNHQPTVIVIPHAAQASVRSDIHPQVLPWVIANSIADSPAARPAAPSQSIVPDVLRGRAGTTKITMAMTTTVNAVVSQKTRW